MSTQTKTNPIAWLVKYFKEAKEEIAKVSWPTKEETFRYSLVVIALCFIFAFFFAGLDYILGLGLQKLIALTK